METDSWSAIAYLNRVRSKYGSDGPRNARVRIMTTKVLCTIVIASFAGIAEAQTAKDDIKDAGQDVKEAGKATGSAAKKTGRATKKAVKKGVNKTAEKTEEGADKVRQKTQ